LFPLVDLARRNLDALTRALLSEYRNHPGIERKTFFYSEDDLRTYLTRVADLESMVDSVAAVAEGLFPLPTVDLSARPTWSRWRGHALNAAELTLLVLGFDPDAPNIKRILLGNPEGTVNSLLFDLRHHRAVQYDRPPIGPLNEEVRDRLALLADLLELVEGRYRAQGLKLAEPKVVKDLLTDLIETRPLASTTALIALHELCPGAPDPREVRSTELALALTVEAYERATAHRKGTSVLVSSIMRAAPGLIDEGALRRAMNRAKHALEKTR